MKNYKIAIIFLSLLGISFYSCKKEVLTDKETIQKHFLGRWLKKYKITTVYNSFTTRIDTTVYTSVDTLTFAEENKFVKRNKTVSSGTYSFDEAGENITLSETTPVTWRINYIRTTTIGLLVSDITTGTGILKVRTLTEEQLIKR